MRREFSAGGLLIRHLRGQWMLGVIRPAGKPDGLWVLPKGQIDPGESSEAAALREVAEETGVHGRSLGKVGETRYWFNWKGERVFKVVTFFLVHYDHGRLGDIPEPFQHEVAEARWIPLEDAPALLAYRGEREMAERALVRVSEL
jgi:8-oxo-dGTP pyrophosphatase MutT (NUDIX family)